MFPVFESIRLEPTGPVHLEQHLLRMQHTARSLWHCQLDFPLLAEQIRQSANDSIQKCKVMYNSKGYKIMCHEYRPKWIHQLHVVQDDAIDYSYKWTDRSSLTRHLHGLPPFAEVLICRQGKITDTSYSNVALWNGHEWHTPAIPLFHGIRRKLLLERQILVEKEIQLSTLSSYSKIALINAMLDMGDLLLTAKQVMR